MEDSVGIIESINNQLSTLSVEKLREINDYVSFLTEKENNRKAFEERILSSMENKEVYTFDSAEDAMDAIRNWKE